MQLQTVAYSARHSVVPALPVGDASLHRAPMAIAISIRPLVASDRELIERGFEALSSDSKYNRFHVPLRTLPDRLARYLTEIDGIDHVALIGFDEDGAAPEPFGVARFVRNPRLPETAELAITIADPYQGRGLARRLFAPLAASARDRGIRSFTMEVLKGNRKARRFVASLGATAIGSAGEVIRYALGVTDS